MPSHSAKQHRFMEAIAHSPSFAKKAGVPQSVGKDYAAADKGKTFSKGGEMKESKAMVGKEVAFMKKKGAPKSMIKHEEAEMKGMKRGGKVRRLGAGGGPLGDESIMTDEEYNKQKEQGAKNWKSLKGFFGFGDREEAAPIDRSRDVVSKPTSSPSAENANLNATYTPRPPLGITKPNTQSPRTRREGENTEDSDAVEREDAAARASRTALNEAEKQKKNAMDAFNPALADAQKQKENAMAAFKRKPTTISKTRETTSVAAAPAKGKVPAKIDSEKLLKDAEEEVLRKKPTAMTEQMRKAPTINDLYAGQKSMGEEFGDMLTNFRNRIREGNEKGRMRQAEKKVETNAKGGSIKAQGGNVKKMRYGGDTGMDMGQPMRGAPMPPRPTAPSSVPPDLEEFERFRATHPTPTPMAVPRPGMKAGGSVKKMAQGGYAKADGVASRGKTQPKMVKMAGGGFVKSADGCAQRGKTKAFQVKMSRGGKC